VSRTHGLLCRWNEGTSDPKIQKQNLNLQVKQSLPINSIIKGEEGYNSNLHEASFLELVTIPRKIYLIRIIYSLHKFPNTQRGYFGVQKSIDFHLEIFSVIHLMG
jgi:hypothetical protein